MLSTLLKSGFQVGGGAVLPRAHVDHALDAENGLMDVDELSEVIHANGKNKRNSSGHLSYEF
jgi:hypothetical protein